jgi:recombination protein RecT
MKKALSADSVQEQFKNALADAAPLFAASLIDLMGQDRNLMQCEPGLVIKEALKAATLRLPINKSLGFSWVIARGKNSKGPDGKWAKTQIPAFQMGWKGWVQLAMRTGQYRYINADMVYEGEKVDQDRITGSITISGEPKNDKVIGYFAFFETLNGFKKSVYWTHEKVHAHAKKYSPSYSNEGGAWQTSPDSMCLKTIVTNLLSKWGILSVEMQQAYDSDHDDYEAQAKQQIDESPSATVNGDGRVEQTTTVRPDF